MLQQQQQQKLNHPTKPIDSISIVIMNQSPIRKYIPQFNVIENNRWWIDWSNRRDQEKVLATATMYPSIHYNQLNRSPSVLYARISHTHVDDVDDSFFLIFDGVRCVSPLIESMKSFLCRFELWCGYVSFSHLH